MIFISVGTSLFQFNRMNDIVRMISKTNRNEQIVYQSGVSVYNADTKRVISKQFLTYSQMQKYMKKARIVILHGGPASIFHSLSIGKKPWVFPRQQKYHEHINDHQVYFCQYLEKLKLIQYIRNDTNIVNVLTNTPKTSVKITISQKLLRYLNEFTETIS